MHISQHHIYCKTTSNLLTKKAWHSADATGNRHRYLFLRNPSGTRTIVDTLPTKRRTSTGDVRPRQLKLADVVRGAVIRPTTSRNHVKNNGICSANTQLLAGPKGSPFLDSEGLKLAGPSRRCVKVPSGFAKSHIFGVKQNVMIVDDNKRGIGGVTRKRNFGNRELASKPINLFKTTNQIFFKSH